MLRSKLNSDQFSKVSLARRIILIGFSHPKASSFSLRGPGNCSCVALTPASMQSKEKEPKERPPGCRLAHSAHPCTSPFGCKACKSAILPICPALLAFDEGCQKGHPWPSGNALHPCNAPAGCSRRKLRYSARQTGKGAYRNIRKQVTLRAYPTLSNA